MSDQSTGNVEHRRKPYTRPEIKRVSLKAEMTVVVGCKNASRTGPGHSTCTTPSSCKTVGS